MGERFDNQRMLTRFLLHITDFAVSFLEKVNLSRERERKQEENRQNKNTLKGHRCTKLVLGFSLCYSTESQKSFQILSLGAKNIRVWRVSYSRNAVLKHGFFFQFCITSNCYIDTKLCSCEVKIIKVTAGWKTVFFVNAFT